MAEERRRQVGWLCRVWGEVGRAEGGIAGGGRGEAATEVEVTRLEWETKGWATNERCRTGEREVVSVYFVGPTYPLVTVQPRWSADQPTCSPFSSSNACFTETRSSFDQVSFRFCLFLVWSSSSTLSSLLLLAYHFSTSTFASFFDPFLTSTRSLLFRYLRISPFFLLLLLVLLCLFYFLLLLLLLLLLCTPVYVPC